VLYISVDGPGLPVRTYGNQDRPQNLTKGPDTLNNLESIRIPNAVPGTYSIQVAVYTILHPPQHYAMVVAGSIASSGSKVVNNASFSTDLLTLS